MSFAHFLAVSSPSLSYFALNFSDGKGGSKSFSRYTKAGRKPWAQTWLAPSGRGTSQEINALPGSEWQSEAAVTLPIEAAFMTRHILRCVCPILARGGSCARGSTWRMRKFATEGHCDVKLISPSCSWPFCPINFLRSPCTVQGVPAKRDGTQCEEFMTRWPKLPLPTMPWFERCQNWNPVKPMAKASSNCFDSCKFHSPRFVAHRVKCGRFNEILWEQRFSPLRFYLLMGGLFLIL